MPPVPDDEDGTPFYLSRWPFLEPDLPPPPADET
jgi:hypothetical protein